MVIPYWSLSNNKLVRIIFGFGCFLKTTLDLHFTMSYYVSYYVSCVSTKLWSWLYAKRAQVLWECAGDQRVLYSSVTRISPTILGLGYVQVFQGMFFFNWDFSSSKTTHPIGNTISKSYQSCYWHSETELTESVCLEVTAKTWDVKEDLIKRVVSLVACKREKLKGC